MTSAQEARADGWQRDTAQRNATVAGLARENRQLREQLAAKGHAMTAEPVPDTGAFADARDRITWQNAAVREAVAAERERIIRLAIQLRATIPADHPAGAQASFADYLRVTAPGCDDDPPPLTGRAAR